MLLDAPKSVRPSTDGLHDMYHLPERLTGKFAASCIREGRRPLAGWHRSTLSTLIYIRLKVQKSYVWLVTGYE